MSGKLTTDFISTMFQDPDIQTLSGVKPETLSLHLESTTQWGSVQLPSAKPENPTPLLITHRLALENVRAAVLVPAFTAGILAPDVTPVFSDLSTILTLVSVCVHRVLKILLKDKKNSVMCPHPRKLKCPKRLCMPTCRMPSITNLSISHP